MSARAAPDYEAARLEWDQPGGERDVVLSERDLALFEDLWDKRLLNPLHIAALHFRGVGEHTVWRRLHRLAQAGYLARCRPPNIWGRRSYPWTYALDLRGHAALQELGRRPAGERWARPRVYSLDYLTHELRVADLMLAWRERLGERFRTWRGPRHAQESPPRHIRVGQLAFSDRLGEWYAHGIGSRPAAIVPDAALDYEKGRRRRTILVELDLTRRAAYNASKLARYDAFLTLWWARCPRYADAGAPPLVAFVCEDNEHRATLMRAADEALVGRLVAPDRTLRSYPGREVIAFILEESCWEPVSCPVLRLGPHPPARRGSPLMTRELEIPGLCLGSVSQRSGRRPDLPAARAESVRSVTAAPGRGEPRAKRVG